VCYLYERMVDVTSLTVDCNSYNQLGLYVTWSCALAYRHATSNKEARIDPVATCDPVLRSREMISLLHDLNNTVSCPSVPVLDHNGSANAV
jgi:hypothetical protein